MNLLDITYNFNDTSELLCSDNLIDQIVGQDHAVEILRLAAKQKRFLIIAGEPGTGKSLLGRALADLMDGNDLEDILVFPNQDNPVAPKIGKVRAGFGKVLRLEQKEKNKRLYFSEVYLIYAAMFAVLIGGLYFVFRNFHWIYPAASAGFFYGLLKLRNSLKKNSKKNLPRILVSNENKGRPPFIDATGAHSGSLFGDVRHDPYQSGGHETPPHELIESGAVHRAHGGVLYIDEVSTLSLESQQNLLAAVQNGEMPITGRSEGSSGSMVRSENVPCRFVLVLAGNLGDMENIHPALRSRIRGYGYEIRTNSNMPVNQNNCDLLMRFIAQEVRNDGKIPHFTQKGARSILLEAEKRSGQKGFLTLRLRELGGLIRAAGDVAVSEKSDLVFPTHVERAVQICRSIEEQGDEVFYA